jgi:hypothetical protein
MFTATPHSFVNTQSGLFLEKKTKNFVCIYHCFFVIILIKFPPLDRGIVYAVTFPIILFLNLIPPTGSIYIYIYISNSPCRSDAEMPETTQRTLFKGEFTTNWMSNINEHYNISFRT